MGAVDQLKKDIVTACRILQCNGLVGAFGHVSARIPGTDRILITPRKGPGHVKAHEILLVSLAGRVMRGRAAPPLELKMHLSIYARRQDVNGICRIRSPMVLVMGVLGRSIRPVHSLGAFFGRQIPVFMRPFLITTDALAEELADVLGNGNAVLLRGSGALVVGKTVVEACVRSIYLEEAAMVQYRSMCVGEPFYFTAEEIAEISNMPYDHYARAWEYFKRECSRER